MSKQLTALAGSCVIIVACRTVPIPEPATIQVPPGLTLQNVEIAILAAITNRPPPEDYLPLQALSDEEFQRLVWGAFLHEAHSRSWAVESRRPGEIIAAVNARGHYLQLGIPYSSEIVTLEIRRTENLNQNASHIHRKVPLWIQRLEQRNRRELGRMSFAGDVAA